MTNTSIFEHHPNPAWARRTWISLDGSWEIEHNGHKGQIQVPYPVGSELSGVDYQDKGTFVYRKTFEIAGLKDDERLLLHIGACDYATTVSVNGMKIGEHTGSYSSFAFDITDAVHSGTNLIVLLVKDSHSPFQVRGKQTFLRKPFYVWYKGIAGVWQSVWLERVGLVHLEHATLMQDFESRIIKGQVWINLKQSNGIGAEALEDYSLSFEVMTPENLIIDFHSIQANHEGCYDFEISFSQIRAKLWSPDSPYLYCIKYHLYRNGDLIDTVESYFGLRSVQVDSNGFVINGKRTFLRMVLVQGYYPGGVYTPQSRAIIENDILNIKAMGYNGARIHEKVESPYFQYLCDKLGLFTSFEMPSFYLPSKAAFIAYERELSELIERDSSHPSCIFRILFNETWGIWGMYWKHSRTRNFVSRMIEMTKKLDPSRPVIENSGWEHFNTDIVDFHHYLRNAALARKVYAGIAEGDQRILFGFSVWKVLAFYLFGLVSTRTRSMFMQRPQNDDSRAQTRPKILLSEYGGFGWYTSENKGSIIDTIEEYTRDIVASKLFCGYCYTQLYDVGDETNGLLTFEREPKIDVDRMRSINAIQ
jgi:beta-galactosidase/beta-glucuronidase